MVLGRKDEKKEERRFRQTMVSIHFALSGRVEGLPEDDPVLVAALRTAAVELSLLVHPDDLAHSGIGPAMASAQRDLDIPKATKGIQLLGWDHYRRHSTPEEYRRLVHAGLWVRMVMDQAETALHQIAGTNETETDQPLMDCYRCYFDAIWSLGMGRALSDDPNDLMRHKKGSLAIQDLHGTTRRFFKDLVGGRVQFDEDMGRWPPAFMTTYMRWSESSLSK